MLNPSLLSFPSPVSERATKTQFWDQVLVPNQVPELELSAMEVLLALMLIFDREQNPTVYSACQAAAATIVKVRGPGAFRRTHWSPAS